MKKKEEINIKITAVNKPSDKALSNLTKLVAELYLEGKLTIPLSNEKVS